MFFQSFVVPDVQKVGSLKQRARRSLFSGEMKNGTPLGREAHLKCAKHLRRGVKMRKTPHVRATFVAQMSKNRTPLWREAHLQVKMYKTPVFWHAF